MVCSNCNIKIDDNSRFCKYCGYNLKERLIEKEEKTDITPSERSGTSKISIWNFKGAKFLLFSVLFAMCLSLFSFCSSIETKYVEDYIDSVNQDLLLTKLGILMSETIVTEKVIVKKASFYLSDSDTIEAIIDLRPQPIYDDKFLAQGNFDLSDKELKRMIKEIVDEILAYNSTSFERLEKEYNLSLGTIYLTVNNYDVAEYKEGVITLVEK